MLLQQSYPLPRERSVMLLMPLAVPRAHPLPLLLRNRSLPLPLLWANLKSLPRRNRSLPLPLTHELSLPIRHRRIRRPITGKSPSSIIVVW
jgi:hypothetical protein